MRIDNYATVVAALSVRPSTVKELVERTGLSRNTVTSALRTVEATVTPGYPQIWAMPEVYVEALTKNDSTSVTHAEARVEVELQAATVPQFEIARKQIGAGIDAYIVNRKTDPRKLAERYALAASVFASMAYALQQRQDDPNWYTELGGQ